MGPQESNEEKKRKWSENLIKRFLEIYEQHPCLWDLKCRDYNDKEKRELALNNVVASMLQYVPDFDVPTAKTKMRSIRNAYTLELYKVMRSKKNSISNDAVYKPSTKWFEIADRVLKGDVQTIMNRTEVVKTDNYHYDSDGGMDEDTSGISHTDDESEMIFKRPQTSRMDTDFEPSPPKKKKPSNCHLSRVNETLTMLKEFSQVVTNCDDELDIFGRSVVNHLRSLPLCKALECQAYIQNYLIQQRIDHLKSTPPRPESSLSSVNYTSPMSPFYQQSDYNSNESSMSYE